MADRETSTESEVQASTRESRRGLLQMLVFGAIASAAGIAIGLAIDWFPVQASGEAKAIDTLWDVLVIVSVPIFVLVVTVVLYSVQRFRMRPGEELKDGPPIHGNTKLEIVWTAIPAVLLVCLSSYAYIVLRDIEEAKANTMEVRVVGEQFTWTFYYRDQGREVVSNQLYLPVGQPVKFNVQSKDVIHDFWVPAFRLKIDAVPGITTDFRVTTERPGRYPIVCAELCGLGHSVMRQTAHVVSREQYVRWLDTKRERGQAGAGGQGGAGAGAPGNQTAALDGRGLFNQIEPRCSSCHTLGDADARGTIGPNLDRVLRGQTPEQIRASIVVPDARITPGYAPNVMPPNYGETLDPAEVDELVEYLAEETG